MTPRSLQDLYVHQLRDLYSAERQLVDALADFVDKAHHEELKVALRRNLVETERQRDRLEQIFESFEESPTGETCQAMKGLIREAKHFFSEVENIFSEDAPPAVIDAGLIASVQRIEHYEIAGYGTVAHYAEMLGRDGDARLLRATLDEEKQADDELNRIAMATVNLEAAVTA